LAQQKGLETLATQFNPLANLIEQGLSLIKSDSAMYQLEKGRHQRFTDNPKFDECHFPDATTVEANGLALK